MLDSKQLSDLQATKTDIQNKQLILNTAVDIQVLLRILVDKEIITRDEVRECRDEVRQSPKYKSALIYVEQTLQEIDHYEKNPQDQLREMFNRKLQGND